ncbi:MAG: DUF6850 family outer membrane beta-barrel protein [Ignavibacteriaceae bacterium]
MKIRFYYIIGLVILCSSAIIVNAQEFSTYFDYPGKDQLNQYYFGKNPAFLKFGKEDELLGFRSGINHFNGSFKRFIDPEEENLYTLSASGQKSIDGNQFFKGSFNLIRLERLNWDWIFVREYEKSIFLIGDSTSGKSRFTGILLNSEYSIRIPGDILFGAEINYLVDEGLKEVSPRPTSEHRYIDVSLGLGYTGFGDLTLGVKGNVHDQMEKVVYQEDQGALTKETIILKFRGYDYPNVFRKKSEVRYSYGNSYFGQFDFAYRNNGPFRISGFVSTGIENYLVKDDAINPESDGYMQNNIISAGVISNYQLSSEFNIGFSFNTKIEDLWGKSPRYNVLYYEESRNFNSLTFAAEYNFQPGTSATLEIGDVISNREVQDHYSDIQFSVKGNKYTGAVGLHHELLKDVKLGLAYQYSENKISDKSLNPGINSDYFLSNRIEDIYFCQSDFNSHRIKFLINFCSILGGDIKVVVDYGIIKPGNTDFFAGMKKEVVNSFVEYKVKVF